MSARDRARSLHAPAKGAHGAEAPIPQINPWSWRAARLILRGLFEVYLSTDVSGRANLPAPGVPTIVAANHVSGLDLFAAGYAVQRTGYVLAKEEATRIPVFGRFIKSVGAIPAARDGRDLAAVKTCVRVLERGRLVGLAPEGTRSRDGRMKPFDPGFIWLAAHTGATVVPCAIHGSATLLPRGARIPRRGTVWVAFGEGRAFPPDAATSRQAREVAADEVRAAVRELLRGLVTASGIPSPALEAP